MIRKSIILLILFISINGFLFSQNLDFKFYSSISDGDFKNDYRGYALALYIDEIELNTVEDNLKKIGRDLNKLKKSNLWLCWKALNEWEYYDGETYLIICTANLYSENGIMIIATIKDNGESFDWWGKSISIDDLE